MKLFKQEKDREQWNLIGEYISTGLFIFIVSIISLKFSSLNLDYSLGTFLFSLLVIAFSNTFWSIIAKWYTDKFGAKNAILSGFFLGFLAWLMIASCVSIFHNYFGKIWLISIAVYCFLPIFTGNARNNWLVKQNIYSLFELEKIVTNSYILGFILTNISSIVFLLIFMMSGELQINNKIIAKETILFSCIGGIICLLFFVINFYSQIRYSYNIQNDKTNIFYEKSYIWFIIAYVGAAGFKNLYNFTVFAFLLQLSEGISLELDKRYFLIFFIVSSMGGIVSFTFWKELYYKYKKATFLASLFLGMIPIISIAPILWFSKSSFVESSLTVKMILFLLSNFGYHCFFSLFFGLLSSFGKNIMKSYKRYSGMISCSNSIIYFIDFIIILILLSYKKADWDLQNGIVNIWCGCGLLFFVLAFLGTWKLTITKNTLEASYHESIV